MTDSKKLEAVRLLLGIDSNMIQQEKPQRKETRKETYHRLLCQVNEYEASRLIKKNLC